MARKIRISVDVNYAGIDIPDEYYDLPDGWDNWPEKKQQDYLSDLAVAALETVATSGASVVDENGEIAE